MFADRLDKTRLRSFIALRFRKPYLLPGFQLLKAVIGDTIAVKVDFTAIAASDKAVICLGMKLCDYPMGRDLVQLHLTAPSADDILKLPPCGLECIADCYVDVLMSPGHCRLAAHDNIRGIGNNEVNPDVKDVALVVTVLRAGNDNLTADDPAEKLLKLGSFFPDTRLDDIGMLNAFEGDLKGDLHRKPHRASL
jgi:hypothetical protein